MAKTSIAWESGTKDIRPDGLWGVHEGKELKHAAENAIWTVGAGVQSRYHEVPWSG